MTVNEVRASATVICFYGSAISAPCHPEHKRRISILLFKFKNVSWFKELPHSCYEILLFAQDDKKK